MHQARKPTFYDTEAAAAIEAGMWFGHEINGVSWRDDRGHSRQDATRHLVRAEELELVREPENTHDPFAVAIHNGHGLRLGYCSAKPSDWWEVEGGLCRWLAVRLDAGERWRVFLRSVVGGRSGSGKETVGARLVFAMIMGTPCQLPSRHPLGELADLDDENPFRGDARSLYGDLLPLWTLLPPEHQASLNSVIPGILRFGGAPNDVCDYMRQLRDWARTLHA